MKLLIVGVVATVGLLSLRGVIGLFSLEGVMLSLLVKEEVKHASDLEEMKEVSNFREQLDAMTAWRQIEDLQRELPVLNRETAELCAKAVEGSRSCAWSLETREALVDHSHTWWFAGGWCFS